MVTILSPKGSKSSHKDSAFELGLAEKITPEIRSDSHKIDAQLINSIPHQMREWSDKWQVLV